MINSHIGLYFFIKKILQFYGIFQIQNSYCYVYIINRTLSHVLTKHLRMTFTHVILTEIGRRRILCRKNTLKRYIIF